MDRDVEMARAGEPTQRVSELIRFKLKTGGPRRIGRTRLLKHHVRFLDLRIFLPTTKDAS